MFVNHLCDKIIDLDYKNLILFNLLLIRINKVSNDLPLKHQFKN